MNNIQNFTDKFEFIFSCKIEMGERKNVLKRVKNDVFHRNIYSYCRNYMSYERNYICYEAKDICYYASKTCLF